MSQPAPPDFTPVEYDVRGRSGALRVAGWASASGRRRPDVVWLHANGFNALTYRNALGPLAGELGILAIDQRGHGATPQARTAEGLSDAMDLRDDLLALLEVVAADRPVILAGHSLGGCVSLLAAAEAPGRVRGLALFDPVVLSRQVSAEAMANGGPPAGESPLIAKARRRRRRFASRQEAFAAYRGRAIFATWPEAAVRDYVAAGFRDLDDGAVELACAPEWEAAIFAAHAHDIWQAMSRVEAPAEIYRAEHDSTCAIAEAADFPRPAGQVRVTTIAGSSHFLPIERPEVVRTALRAMAAATAV